MEIVKEKKCSKCHVIKQPTEFHKNKHRKSGLKPQCKQCIKEYAENNKEKEATRKRLWYLENREKSIERSKNRQILKRNERNKYLNEYYKQKSYLYIWRGLVYRTLNNTIKTQNTLEILGYSATELKHHLESLFTDCMSWNNYGEWHIDHIKPLSSFELGTPPSIVNALSNLQPLWATTREINGIIYEGNLNKGNTYLKNN